MPDKTEKKPNLEVQPGGRGALKRDAGPGRPKGSVSIVTELKKVLAEEGNAEKVARAIVLHAAKGNGAAIRHLLERVDGKLPDVVEHKDKSANLTTLTDEELRQYRALQAKVEDASGD